MLAGRSVSAFADRERQVGQCRAYPSCGFRWAHYGLLRQLRSFLSVRFFCRSKLEGPVRPYGVASQLRPHSWGHGETDTLPFFQPLLFALSACRPFRRIFELLSRPLNLLLPPSAHS